MQFEVGLNHGKKWRKLYTEYSLNYQYPSQTARSIKIGYDRLSLPCTHYPDQRRRRERERRREKTKMSSMQWSVQKEVFALNHSKISDTALQIGSFCVLRKWVHSEIGQCVRPAVHTITLHNYIRLNWNFLHRIVSSISRSSSKVRRVRQEMAELSKKLSLLTRHSWAGVQGFFKKTFSELFTAGINRLNF